MKKVFRTALGIVVAVIFASAGFAGAQTYSWDFATSASNGDFGTSHVFTSLTGGFTITAYGYSTQYESNTFALPPASPPPQGSTWNTGTGGTGTITPMHLWAKYTSGNLAETGLGTMFDAQHEIEPQTFVQLDLQNLKANGLTQLSVIISSMTYNASGGEGVLFWKSNVQGTPGTLWDSSHSTSTFPANGEVTVPIDISTFQYLSVNAWSNGASLPDLENIVLRNGFRATVPEPGTFGLVLAGLLGVAAILRRRSR